MSITNTMKKVAAMTYQASAPAAYLFGTVSRVSPLIIRVDDRFDIDADMIVLMEQFKQGGVSALKSKDKVVLLRNMGGQQFLVLGKV